MRSAYPDMVKTIAWFIAHARISCGTKFKVIRTSTVKYRRVARKTSKLCIQLEDTGSRESTLWMFIFLWKIAILGRNSSCTDTDMCALYM